MGARRKPAVMCPVTGAIFCLLLSCLYAFSVVFATAMTAGGCCRGKKKTHRGILWRVPPSCVFEERSAPRKQSCCGRTTASRGGLFCLYDLHGKTITLVQASIVCMWIFLLGALLREAAKENGIYAYMTAWNLTTQICLTPRRFYIKVCSTYHFFLSPRPNGTAGALCNGNRRRHPYPGPRLGRRAAPVRRQRRQDTGLHQDADSGGRPRPNPPELLKGMSVSWASFGIPVTFYVRCRQHMFC